MGRIPRSRRWLLRTSPVAAVAGVIATALAGVGGLAGCASRPPPVSDSRPMSVVAGFYPLAYVATLVGGDRVRVRDLVPPGAEPHDLELSPHRLADIADANLVIYLRGFQPALDEAVDQNAAGRTFDAAGDQPLLTADAGTEQDAGRPLAGGRDPHLWLDPTRLAATADRLARRLAALDPTHAAGFQTRASQLGVRLAALDREYASGLSDCARRDIVTSHAAFGYLAARYRLTQIPISGLTPEDEPMPGRLAAVAKLARQRGVTTIFFETLVSPKVARTLAAEVGTRTEVLDPVESAPPTGDYVSAMRTNLGRLRTALGCS